MPAALGTEKVLPSCPTQDDSARAQHASENTPAGRAKGPLTLNQYLVQHMHLYLALPLCFPVTAAMFAGLRLQTFSNLTSCHNKYIITETRARHVPGSSPKHVQMGLTVARGVQSAVSGATVRQNKSLQSHSRGERSLVCTGNLRELVS